MTSTSGPEMSIDLAFIDIYGRSVDSMDMTGSHVNA